MARGDIHPGPRAGQVRVEQRLDGSMAVKFRQCDLRVRECPARPKTSSHAGELAETSTQGGKPLDKGLQSAQKSSVADHSGTGKG